LPHGGSSFCHSILRTSGLGGAVSPGVHRTPLGIRKEVSMAEGAMAITLLVALLVIDRLVGRKR
jgi:hypothetical protein